MPSGTSCHGPSSVRHQATEDSAAPPGFSRRSAVTSLRKAMRASVSGGGCVGRDSTVSMASMFGSSSWRPEPHTAWGGAGHRSPRTSDIPDPRSQRSDVQGHAQQRRQHGVHGRVLVDHRLELAVGTLEALALEVEGGRLVPDPSRGNAPAPPPRGHVPRRARSSCPSHAGIRRLLRCATARRAPPGTRAARAVPGSGRGRRRPTVACSDTGQTARPGSRPPRTESPRRSRPAPRGARTPRMRRHGADRAGRGSSRPRCSPRGVSFLRPQHSMRGGVSL